MQRWFCNTVLEYTLGMKLTQMQAARRRTFKRLIKTQFDGNASAFARAIGKSHTYIWQLDNGYRSIGDLAARNIEEKLDLDYGALDRDYKPKVVKKKEIQLSVTRTARIGRSMLIELSLLIPE